MNTLFAKSSAFAILGVVALIWLMHPVCQVNIPTDGNDHLEEYNATWHTLYRPSDLMQYVAGGRTIMINGRVGYCKSWIGKEMFF